MNACRFPRLSFIFCALFGLLLAACQPAVVTTALPPTAVPPAATPLPSLPPPSSGISLDPQVEVVPAVQPGADQPWWGPMPRHSRINLSGYPASSNPMKPQILIYPLTDLPAYNENAARAAADLNLLLQNRQPTGELPFLPLQNARQALHAQVQFLDFKNGKGVRYLTQFNQGPVMINNAQLIYTFQGLTADNQYYIAAVLPVSHPELPGEEKVYSQNAEDLKNYGQYAEKMAAWLDEKTAASFTPNLAALDELVQSLEVK